MRIGILTQALHGNYGGILQNYALQQILIGLGHSPVTIDRHFNRHDGLIKAVAKWCARIIKSQYETGLLTRKQRTKLIEPQLRFIKDNINRVGPLYTQSEFDDAVNSTKYDALVVGSDQCWRPRYSTNIANYFLDFCIDSSIKKIAYAASFGTDEWEYGPELTRLASDLTHKFDAISVREKSGVEICGDKLGVCAEWVLDPTMLLGTDGFRKFIKKTECTGIVTYLLENSTDNHDIIEFVKAETEETQLTCNLSNPLFHRFESINSHINLPVEDWLSNIANAKFVITDSFHGVAFSILFKIPFIVRLNGVRGNARIESLLEDFGLKGCLYDSDKTFKLPDIDWQAVNNHLSLRQSHSLNFLTSALR